MKKAVTILVAFLFGILLGMGIGIVVGMQIERAGQEQQSPLPSVTEEPSATPEPNAMEVPSPMLESGKTETPSQTPEPSKVEVPSSTEEPNPMLEPSATEKPSATEAPSPMPKPSKTETPSPTLEPSKAEAPSPTLEPSKAEAPSPTLEPSKAEAPSPTLEPSKAEAPGPTLEPEKVEKQDFYGALHVEGTHLAAEDGTLVQLRGVSTHGLGWFPEYVNEAMVIQIRQEWGCNLFRLAMYTAEYNGYCTSGSKQKEALKEIIDTGVQAAINQNMYVIIDWHILSDGNPNTYKEEAKKFFAEMAQKYADVPNVIYEICNEPNGGTNWSVIKQYALELIPVIRTYAPEAVIIVGTPTWSQDVDLAANDPITEYDNIMYALHFYAATHKDGLREKCKTAVAKGLPLFVTEYGICDASGNGAIDEAQANQWIDLLDRYGISHAMWNLSNKSETSAMIQSGCNKTSNLSRTELSAAGVWFVERMKQAGLGSEDWVMPEADDNNNAVNNDNTVDNNNAVNNNNTADNNNTENATLPKVLQSHIPTIEELFEESEELSFSIVNSWTTPEGYGIQLNVVIKNTRATEENDWSRIVQLKNDRKIALSQYWCAKVSLNGTVLELYPENYNKTVPAGGEVSGIGIILEVK